MARHGITFDISANVDEAFSVDLDSMWTTRYLGTEIVATNIDTGNTSLSINTSNETTTKKPPTTYLVEFLIKHNEYIFIPGRSGLEKSPEGGGLPNFYAYQYTVIAALVM